MEPNPQPNPPQDQPLVAQVADQPAPPLTATRPRRAGRWLLVLLVVGLCGSLLLNVLLFVAVGLAGLTALETDRRVQEKFHSYNPSGRSKVAIISVSGAILSGEGFVKRQIDRVREDDGVKAVVLRVDSPGGTVTGSDYIYHHLRELAREKHIPIVVSMGGLAASGGYYVSMAVGDTPNTLFAEPTTWTGSIGVIIPHYNLSGLLDEKLGIKEDSVMSDRLKDMGNFARPMTKEERQIFQELVNQSFTHFKDIVKDGRPEFRKSPEALDKLATGQVYTAQQAVKNGLVDKIGFIEEAIERAIELAKLDKNDVKVVEYKRAPNLADLLLGVNVRSQRSDLGTILEMAAPRAYYLCTWLPPLASSGRQE